jgi:hypothetical protein
MSGDTEALVITLVRAMQQQLIAVDDKLTAYGLELQDHMKSEPQEVADIMDAKMKSAFPNGDLDGHRVAHEAAIKAALDRADYWHKMLFEVTKYGLFGVQGWLTYVAWTSFLQGPHK